ncbi:hypothetical protein GCM10023219_29580 [Stakelama sediminis]|uniref:Uncharacterized protein n=1 Tax=Stakelama sediminis TaxID=463200 RepID=A0A840Z2A5_9SPHN|nr:hypothetical protein [Stakelama sediminis]MBB5720271.1 hypothetical protein [Stakelama sediminis]
MADPKDVTGVWYGRWTSGSGNVLPNRFIALLSESAGIVSGLISEPDLYDTAGTLHAIVHGSRNGAALAFTKQYDGSGRLAHAVAYRGTVSGDGTEVSGEWALTRHSGAFVMTREVFTADELEEAEEVELTVPLGETR